MKTTPDSYLTVNTLYSKSSYIFNIFIILCQSPSLTASFLAAF